VGVRVVVYIGDGVGVEVEIDWFGGGGARDVWVIWRRRSARSSDERRMWL